VDGVVEPGLVGVVAGAAAALGGGALGGGALGGTAVSSLPALTGGPLEAAARRAVDGAPPVTGEADWALRSFGTGGCGRAIDSL